MRAVRAVLGLVVIGAAGMGGLWLTERLLAASEPVPVAQGAAAPLRVETIVPPLVTFADAVTAVGTARARQAVDLLAESGGRVTRIAFEPGDRVEAGAVLLELDDRAEQADLKAADATLAEAQAAFDRQQSLNRSGSASDAAYQTARAALLRAEAERDRAGVVLEDRSLRAPFAGIIGLTDLVEGQVIDTATPIATLDDLSVIAVDFSVPETLLPRLERGQRVDLASAAWPGRTFRGAISRIDSRVDAATRSLALRAEIPNNDRALAGGMFLQVRLVLDERQRPAVPENALTVEGDRTLVMVADGGTARPVEIVTGQQQDGLVEVVSGLAPSARVIVTNLHRLSDGTPIEAVAPERRVEAAAPSGGGG
ncbi:efflux RND transporter periplasmic adaptor subunit [Paracoccus sp. YIM 132242]|uniref:Efflux RND transporter periplasmic adaptor subunit n=1 Tax=Paracoccus lichenicola TaxID=2665644 RepID=A0A6L6HU21_9RHOB|nr:efflux RND transporter periplasmic adaptor subunit [Paracoccus lichenicola]MTE01762.1 efflux RND transporter periplasmic adaptor subunit [Paracoccus lichenicola]